MLIDRVRLELSDPRVTPVIGSRRTDPRRIAERLADWSEQARMKGRPDRSEYLLLRAWEAYERAAGEI